MSPSRREVLAALSALLGGSAQAAPPPIYSVQGGQYESFDGARLFYRRLGSGRPVILLHGFLSDGPRNWFSTGVAQTLVDAGFSVVAPDARAHGLSAAPPGPYPKDALAMDVEALVRALDLRSYRILGYAMGGRTALRLMARGARPERCVLGGVGAHGVLQTDEVAAANAATIRAGRDARDPKLGVEVRAAIRLQKLSAQALIAVLDSQASTSAAELSRIHTPILVLNGQNDTVERDASALANLLPDATVERIPGDHFTAPRQPRFAEIAAAFLRSRAPPRTFAPPPQG